MQAKSLEAPQDFCCTQRFFTTAWSSILGDQILWGLRSKRMVTNPDCAHNHYPNKLSIGVPKPCSRVCLDSSTWADTVVDLCDRKRLSLYFLTFLVPLMKIANWDNSPNFPNLEDEQRCFNFNSSYQWQHSGHHIDIHIHIHIHIHVHIHIINNNNIIIIIIIITIIILNPDKPRDCSAAGRLFLGPLWHHSQHPRETTIHGIHQVDLGRPWWLGDLTVIKMG